MNKRGFVSFRLPGLQLISLLVLQDESAPFSPAKNPAFVLELFDVLPHEIADDGLRHEPRWFSDGVADYVAVQFAKDRVPEIRYNFLLTRMPEVSFVKHRAVLQAPWPESPHSLLNELYGESYYFIERAAVRSPDDFREIVAKSRSLSEEELVAAIESLSGIDLDSEPPRDVICDGLRQRVGELPGNGGEEACEYRRRTGVYFLQKGICIEEVTPWTELRCASE